MNFITELSTVFKKHTSIQKAAWQEAYMKHHFQFLGIAKPIRVKLEKSIFKQYSIDTEQELIALLKKLWNQENREYQYTACELAYYYRTLWTPNILPIFEYMIRTKSWWDTVDTIAAHLVGLLLQKNPSLITLMDNWIADHDIWIRRTALLFQLRWKIATNKEQLFSYCTKTMHEKEFFIRKAIGWALREYSKTNPDAVRIFIATHRNNLSGLSIREGSKYI